MGSIAGGPTRRGLALGGLSAMAWTDIAKPGPAARGGTTRAASMRTRPAIAGLQIDVTAFGARGDGQTDDSQAINVAFAEARRTRPRTRGVETGCRIAFPTGAYVVRSGLDMTGLRDLNTLVDGQGSVIIGCCAGQAVIDALGSRWLTIRDLTIVGDRTLKPATGLQVGVLSADVVADDHLFDNLKIVGSFGLACLYNRGAETSAFFHALLWNDASDGYCLVQDGCNHFGVSSAFAAADLPRGADLSFNENIFVGCDFRNGGGGTTVWLGDTTRHAFVRCYSATSGGPSFLLHCGANGHTMLDVDCHCESAGLQDVFCVSSAPPGATIRGFSFRDHANFAERCLFTTDRPMHVSIENARIEVATYRSRACRVFDEQSHFTVGGSYYSSSRRAWNGDDVFRGRAIFGQTIEEIGCPGARAGWGARSDRPRIAEERAVGQLYFDQSIRKLLVWSGTEWVDTGGVPH